MSLSDFAELELLDHFLGVGNITAIPTVYIGYSTADPLDDASGLAEPSGGGYSRKAITFNAAASRKIQNQAVTFNQATGSQGTVTHYAIFDALTSGNMLAHGSFDTAKTIVSGNTPSIAAAEIEISFSTAGASDYLAHKLLELMFRNVSYTAPTIYCAVTTAIITDSMTGSTITEPSGGAYARKAHSAWDTASAGASENTGAITFTEATASWGTIVYAGLVDASTAGNLLVFLDITNQAVASGDTVEFADGDFNITLS
jgi:hypothetical protein